MTIYTKKDFYPKGKRAFRILRVFWKIMSLPKGRSSQTAARFRKTPGEPDKRAASGGTIFKITVVVFIVNNLTFIVFINIVNVY